MRFTSWWAQAIGRGVTMALAIWLVSAAVVVIGALVVGWGPLEFLHFGGVVGSYLLVIILAFTAPFWVVGGLMVLVSLGLWETRERRGEAARDGTGDSSAQSVRDGRFQRRWSRWWGNVERGVVGWFVIRPALVEGKTTADVSVLPDDDYLRAYVRRWIVQALILFATLAFIAVISTASSRSGDTAELAKHVMNPAVPAFGIALGVCSMAIVRYAVTIVMLNQRGGELE